MHVPTDKGVSLSADAAPPDSFLPKACIHTFAGHTKGVSSMKLFPGSGHLLLTGSMDTKVKLWDVYNEGNCLRTFAGHGQAVKDVAFNKDGSRFLTASYDRQMKLWDTETGACLKAFTTGKRPHVVAFHPDEDKQHVFLAGMQDKKIVQVRSPLSFPVLPTRPDRFPFACCARACSLTRPRVRSPKSTTCTSARSTRSLSSMTTGDLSRRRTTRASAPGTMTSRSTSSTLPSLTCTRCRL